jgi:hypothetical protein
LWDAVREKRFVQPSPSFQAIGSGLAAYLPCSFSDRREIGSKAAAMAGRNPASLFSMSDLRSVKVIDLNDDVSIQMDAGSIWGSIFWEMRELMSKDVADRVLVMAWKNVLDPVDKGQGYRAFFKSVLEADRSMEAGKHLAQLKMIFNRRGVQ